ncbi:MAG: UbiA family prenyltransferase [Phycisphaerales bacterium]|nr:MAG: UbiA family prenyltransferase [Phycisphaerales bacterium]
MASLAAGGMDYLQAVAQLAKVRITAAVTLTTATGYILAARQLDWSMCMPLIGVFLLASGSAALNQWQERAIDIQMRRTRGRPLPGGRIDPAWALFCAVLLVLFGFFLLTSIPHSTGLLLALGALALLWYNAVYTYLKRVTAFAVVPGALIGAIPPLIGYVSAGGKLNDPQILLVALFFFIWQIPHFWLLMMMFGGEYREAGLPTVVGKFAKPQLLRITFMWMLSTAAAGLAFTTLRHIDVAMPWSFGLVGGSFWLAAKATAILGVPDDGDDKLPLRRAFRQINVYAVVVMICLSLSALGR